MANERYMNYTDIVRLMLNNAPLPLFFNYRNSPVDYNEDRLSQVGWPAANKELAQQFLDALQDRSQESADFLARVYLISSVIQRRTYGPALDADATKLFLKNIDKITDAELRANGARRIYQDWKGTQSSPIAKDALTIVLNSGHATIDDFAVMAQNNWFTSFDELDHALAAGDKLAQTALDAEMKKETPDIKHIDKITGGIEHLAWAVEDNSRNIIRTAKNEPYNLAYRDELRKKYNKNAILAAGVQYMPQYQAGIEKEVSELRGVATEGKNLIARQNREIDDLKKQIEHLRAQLTRAHEQIDANNQNITMKNAELAVLRNSVENITAQAQRVIDATEKVKGGVGSSGVNEVKKAGSELQIALKQNSR